MQERLDSYVLQHLCHDRNPSIILKIGSVPTPWPSWLIAAHPSPTRAPQEGVRAFLQGLTKFIRTFDSAKSRVADNVNFIKANFGYPENDIEVCNQCSAL